MNLRSKRKWLVEPALLSIALAISACGSGGDSVNTDDRQVGMAVISSRDDMTTGGDALVRVDFPADVAASDIRLEVNGTQVATARTATTSNTFEALITGLPLGPNEVRAIAPHTRPAIVRLNNHPATGPVFSGDQLTPFECRTQEAGLGEPLDTNCSVARRYDWFYFTAGGTRQPLPDPLGPRPADLATTTTLDGRTVPFIVRVESGTLNRSIYRIAVLDDPQAAGVWNPAGWNKRIILRFGESTGAQYNQGFNTLNDAFKSDAADNQSITALGRGFAYVVSSLNVHRVNVNDALAAETAMMLREHFTETYGAPRWMLGMGGSGGAIQQMLIAQNYPGILDGIMPDAAFPDVMSTVMAVSDCRLLNRYFQQHPSTDAVRKAFEGHMKGTCATWDAGNGDAIVATSGSVTPACGLKDQSLVYHPTNNPTGVRCTVYDVNAKSLGKDQQGRAHRPLDNLGVQYGLAGLRSGAIGAEEFVTLNEAIGGYDLDGNLVPQRTSAVPEGLMRAYQTGRVASGGGGLATTPMMHTRAYGEPAGDIHTAYNDIKIRAQLVRSNGQANNQVIWVLPNPGLAPLLGLGTSHQLVLAQLIRSTFVARLDLMTQWLDVLMSDPAPLTPEKVARTKPVDAVDSCWDLASTARIREPATLDGVGTCNTLYPKTPTPRMVAGAPVTDDVLKCQLKPLDESEYLPVALSPSQLERLRVVFPDGVCDFRKQGVAQVPLGGIWQRY